MPKSLNIALTAFVFILLLALSGFCAEETITMTTFYPSPYGSYNELSTLKMKIGEGYSESTVSPIDNGLIVEGDVGIGTVNPKAALDVQGGVRIGEDNTDCISDKAGTLRYNNGQLEYCNGSSWTSATGIPSNTHAGYCLQRIQYGVHITVTSCYAGTIQSPAKCSLAEGESGGVCECEPGYSSILLGRTDVITASSPGSSEYDDVNFAYACAKN